MQSTIIFWQNPQVKVMNSSGICFWLLVGYTDLLTVSTSLDVIQIPMKKKIFLTELR